MTAKELRDALQEFVRALPGVVQVDATYYEGSYMFGESDAWCLDVHQHAGDLLAIAVTVPAHDVPDEED